MSLISVTAVAGTAPVFEKSAYILSISDNAAIGASVGKVAAADPDGSAVTYALTAGNTNSTFNLNSSTGTLAVAKRLNHHYQDRFSLTIKATDAEGLSSTATAVITVTAGTQIADFTSITWGTAASQPIGTHEVHGETVNGKLYIFGGYDVLKQPSWTPTKRAYVYDPATNTWSPIADLPHLPKGTDFGGITHEGLATDGTDIYLAGGYTSNSSGTGQVFGTKQVYRYNVGSNTYTRLPDLPKELAAGQMQYLKGKLHYAGGANLSRSDIAEHYVLDLDNLGAGWKAAAPLANPRNHPGSAVFEGKMYYIGGAHHQDDNTVTQATVERYDPETDSWTYVASMPTGLDHISSSVIVLGNRILVLGGETSHNVKTSQVLAYSAASNSWAKLTPLPATTSAGVAAAVNGVIYYTGGNFSKTNRKGQPAGTTTSQQVASLTLINADNNQDLQTLTNGATLNLATLPTKNFNIRANTNPATVGSVSFQLSGAQTKSVTESIAPYAFYGDDNNGDYYAWTPALGNYTIKATPYTASKGSGTAGTALTVTFSVVNQASALVSNVSASSGRSYKVADLAVGALPYTDRTYTITSVPSSLTGATLVLTANDDKKSTSSALLTFDLSETATIYVAYDPRGTALPSWLSGWTKLSDKIGINDSKISAMNLYSKSFAAGKVTLGGNLASPAAGAENNYFVVAKPAPVAAATLISNVAATSGKSYKVADLAVGALMYTDRTYKITSVPSTLTGATLIQTANDDKKSTSTSLLSFDLSEAATVYVAYDPRATALPTWLSGWTKLADKLGVDDSQISAMNLYSKSFAAGKVTLGGNLASPAAGSQTNYLVVAKASSQGLAATQTIAREQPHTDIKLQVFPNPTAGDKLYVELENFAAQEAIVVTLVDVVGRSLLSQTIIANAQGRATAEILTSTSLKQGIYLINAQAASGNLQSKIIVQ
ncbi:kelch repeat-containing protein [Pontibacter liquoris]|uniref:kelch repeat-containing protein n=1 Tax=Pontibacter liquoris TaxID=2905677 RepID=UPI001FA7742C|nr:kelch repeat-containing protein [Pontibacter liquoris]